MPPRPQPLSDKAALFLDFDGTLVEIASRPDGIRVDPQLAGILKSVETRLDGALGIVSGRSIAAIDHYLNASVTSVAGIHGAEYRDPTGRIFRSAVDTGVLDNIRAKLQRFVDLHDNVVLEDKGISLSLHFRNAPADADGCREMVDACAHASGDRFERIDGQMVVELKPVGSDKGKVVVSLLGMPPFAGREPIYVGDDITDESAFAAVSRIGGVAIAVGPRQTKFATALLPTVADAHRWLEVFAHSKTIVVAS